MQIDQRTVNPSKHDARMDGMHRRVNVDPHVRRVTLADPDGGNIKQRHKTLDRPKQIFLASWTYNNEQEANP